MPIRQETIIALMEESRENISNHQHLTATLLEYFRAAKERFYNNPELHRVLGSAIDIINFNPKLADKETYVNERHYQKHKRQNDKGRARQEAIRRANGVPTQEEALAILNGRNELRRAGLPTNPEVYKSHQERLAEHLLAGGNVADFMQPIKRQSPSRHGLIIPDDSDEPPLEFDLPENVAIDLGEPKLLNERNLQTGLDIPVNLLDNASDTKEE